MDEKERIFGLKKFVLVFLGFILALILMTYWQIPSTAEIRGCIKTTMYKVDLCPKSKDYVTLKNISQNLQKAILSTEDGKFYSHNGFDSEGIEHCIDKIRTKGKFVCGGSTITQQLAKNMFLSKDKNLIRKGWEALITIKIERTLSKKEILEKYLNVIQFGKNVFGVKQAAQFYFGKSPSQLDVLESAFLAMVLPNPEKYSQSYYRKDFTKFARRRITTIIQNMYSYKMIPEESYINAMARIDSFFVPQQNPTAEAPPSDANDVLTEEEIDQMLMETEY